MDKEVIFSVAGSGKTTYLIEKLSLDKRFLIITYTQANYENIKTRITRKFGYLPVNIVCYTYFSFLFSWGIKPFNITQCPPIRKIDYENKAPRHFRNDNIKRYVLEDSIYHRRLYDFLTKKNLKSKFYNRIEKFFDAVLIDEVQDFAGYDFDFIMDLGKSKHLSLSYVGDFYQHTYDTSRDGVKNRNLHDNYENYRKRFTHFSHASLTICYRCPEAVCKFISEKLGIELKHHEKNDTQVAYPRLLDNDYEINQIISDKTIPKLFYKKADTFSCNAMTWGESKGLEFDNVCVVLNQKTAALYGKGMLSSLPQKTLNKLYVACSRTKGNLYFIEEKRLSSWKRDFTQPNISCKQLLMKL